MSIWVLNLQKTKNYKHNIKLFYTKKCQDYLSPFVAPPLITNFLYDSFIYMEEVHKLCAKLEQGRPTSEQSTNRWRSIPLGSMGFVRVQVNYDPKRAWSDKIQQNL